METTNKFIRTIFMFFVTSLVFTSCSPEDGKDGEQGPMGNANVTLYKFEGTYNFANTSFFWFYCESTIGDAENSLWQAFIVPSANERLSYSIPGYGADGGSFYRMHMQNEDSNNPGFAAISIRKQSGAGEVYNKVRIFRILANNTGATNKTIGKRYNGYTEEEVRAMSYEEFLNAFNITEN